MTPLLYVFRVKDLDAIVVLVIRGQLLPQRSHKGHLRSFPAIFLDLAPFSDIFIRFKTIFLKILHDLFFKLREKILF